MTSEEYLSNFDTIKLEELCNDHGIESYQILKHFNVSLPTNNNYMDLKWFENKDQEVTEPLDEFMVKDVLMVPSSEGVDMCAMDTQVKMETDQELNKTESFYYDDSTDLFDVDKNDLIQGPTLAELNATDENLLDDFNFDDFLLPLESWNYLNLSGETRVPRQGHNSTHFFSRHTGEKPVNVPNTLNLSSLGHSHLPASLPNNAHGFNTENLSSSVPTQLTSASSVNPTRLIMTDNEIMAAELPMNIVKQKPPTSPPPEKHSTLHQLLQRTQSPLSPPVPTYSASALSPVDVKQPSSPSFIQLQNSSAVSPARLSSSAPTPNGMDFIWQRREPRKHLLSTGSLAEDNGFAGSASSLSTSELLSPGSLDWSQEDFNSDDSDRGFDDSSDNESEDGGDGCRERSLSTSSSKKERYFWQYNVQSKGPKGQRIVLSPQTSDPHVLSQATDPVFNPSVTLQGIRHSGKARRGDGNDLTPSPKKLWNIGKELDKLSEIINDMTPVSELPFNDRTKSRKEKNKLASRACRLKKKAQHEANKLKLYGLEQEHRRLMEALVQAKATIKKKLDGDLPGQDSFPIIDRLAKGCSKPKIAGFTSEFVNKVLEKVKEGDPRGGLDELLGTDHKLSRHKKIVV